MVFSSEDGDGRNTEKWMETHVGSSGDGCGMLEVFWMNFFFGADGVGSRGFPEVRRDELEICGERVSRFICFVRFEKPSG